MASLWGLLETRVGAAGAGGCGSRIGVEIEVGLDDGAVWKEEVEDVECLFDVGLVEAVVGWGRAVRG
jgi:hypothetical protein